MDWPSFNFTSFGKYSGKELNVQINPYQFVHLHAVFQREDDSLKKDHRKFFCHRNASKHLYSQTHSHVEIK